jgi:hypothetical protein
MSMLQHLFFDTENFQGVSEAERAQALNDDFLFPLRPSPLQSCGKKR